MEQQLSAGLREGQIAELVEDDEVQTGQEVSKPALASCAPLGLEAVDQVDGGEESPTRSGANAASRDGDRQMRFAGTGRTRGILPNITIPMRRSFIGITLATVRAWRS